MKRYMIPFLLCIVSQIFFLTTCSSFDDSSDSSGEASPVAKKVIANWDVVPYQLIDRPFKVGVIAFHEDGVDVEFRVNGVFKEIVKTPTHNNDPTLSRTDKPGFGPIYEYWTEIDPAEYPDGPITISATAYAGSRDSKNDEARTLPDLILYANAGKTLTNTTEKWVADNGKDTDEGTREKPYKTIEKAFESVGPGGTVRVKAGVYTCWNASGRGETYKEYKRWTTITKDPDASRDDVIIKPDRNGDLSSDFYQTFVRWHEVTLQYEYDTNSPQTRTTEYMLYTRPHYYTWFDSVAIRSTVIDSPYKYRGYVINDQGSKHYMTNCNIYNFFNVFGWFQRNCFIQNVGSDVWRTRDNLFAVNIHVDNMEPNKDAHPDLIQTYLPGRYVDNIIFFNIKATNMNSQGIHTRSDEGGTCNIAFVNILIEKTIKEIDDRYRRSSLVNIYHMLMWHCTFHNLCIGITSIQNLAQYSQWDIRNNLFYNLYEGAVPSNTEFADISIAAHNLYRFLGWNQSNGPIGITNNLYNAFISRYVPQAEDYPMSQPVYYPGFVNESPFAIGYHSPDTYDYHLKADSPALSAGVPLECVPADSEGKLYNLPNPSLGAYQ